MVEHERKRLSRDGSRKKGKGKKGSRQQRGNSSSDESRRRVDLWMKYVLCFEMLEMEMELHLVDQVWGTVKEMASEVAIGKAYNDENERRK